MPAAATNSGPSLRQFFCELEEECEVIRTAHTEAAHTAQSRDQVRTNHNTAPGHVTQFPPLIG